jgi:hypothetical protein
VCAEEDDCASALDVESDGEHDIASADEGVGVAAVVASPARRIEEIAAEALDALARDEEHALPTWEMPRVPVATTTQTVGEPALRGADLESYELISFGPDLSAQTVSSLKSIAFEFRHCFGGTKDDDASSVPPLCRAPVFSIPLRHDADLGGVTAHRINMTRAARRHGRVRAPRPPGRLARASRESAVFEHLFRH